MNPNTSHWLSLGKKILVPAVAVGTAYYYLKHKRKALLGVAIPIMATSIVSPAYAQMNQSLIDSYASAMTTAANSQNIGKIAELLSDDAVISLNRQGKSATLDKQAYLELLQKSWTQTKDYRYTIAIDEVVITGDQARAVVTTQETWTKKDGSKSTIMTVSRATLGINKTPKSNALLLRAVSQVTVN